MPFNATFLARSSWPRRRSVSASGRNTRLDGSRASSSLQTRTWSVTRTFEGAQQCVQTAERRVRSRGVRMIGRQREEAFEVLARSGEIAGANRREAPIQRSRDLGIGLGLVRIEVVVWLHELDNPGRDQP